MSWKATAYVKELRIAPNGDMISQTEKLILFVLADAHFVDRQCSYPSLADVAFDCLMDESACRRRVRSLEQKGVLACIQLAKGRGARNYYVFLAIDVDPTLQHTIDHENFPEECPACKAISDIAKGCSEHPFSDHSKAGRKSGKRVHRTPFNKDMAAVENSSAAPEVIEEKGAERVQKGCPTNGAIRKDSDSDLKARTNPPTPLCEGGAVEISSQQLQPQQQEQPRSLMQGPVGLVWDTLHDELKKASLSPNKPNFDRDAWNRHFEKAIPEKLEGDVVYLRSEEPQGTREGLEKFRLRIRDISVRVLGFELQFRLAEAS